MKRFAALVMALVLVLAMCCVTAFAASPTDTAPGTSPKTGASLSMCVAFGVAAVAGTSAYAIARKE